MFLVGLYQFWRMSSPRGGLRRGGMMGGLGAARRAPRGGRPGAYGGAGAYSSGPGDGGDYGLGRVGGGCQAAGAGCKVPGPRGAKG